MSSEGFLHHGRIVLAIWFELEHPPPSTGGVVVWLTPDGHAQQPGIRPAVAGKRIVTVHPGDDIVLHGKLRRVIGVSVWREAWLVEGAPQS